MTPTHDAVIVGAGPNGLAAAISLQAAGRSTLLLEAEARVGGGARTSALTLPGFLHDDCSSVHPLGVASPFFRSLELQRHGLEWVQPPAPLVHVLDEETTLTLERSVQSTAAQLGPGAHAYERLLTPFVKRFEELAPMILGPLHWPSSPLLFARFGLEALRSMQGLGHSWFMRAPRAQALLAGIAAHGMVPLASPASASFGLVLAAAAHASGWPVARGGSQAISDALCSHYRELGGEVLLERRITRLSQLPPARAYLFDVTPRQLLTIAGDVLPRGYRRRLERFQHAPGVCKVDWALSSPIPWRDPACGRSATVHLSGSLQQVARAERQVHRGIHEALPFVLLVQPSLFDPSRAPAGHHTAWAYCHVPLGSGEDRSQAIEAHVERFAPGFRRTILARFTRTARDLEQHNPNLVGGDISGGSPHLSQLFFRPVARVDPYSTPAREIFLCSSSTPPGGGVHGMCGYWAARSALARTLVESDGTEWVAAQ